MKMKPTHNLVHNSAGATAQRARDKAGYEQAAEMRRAGIAQWNKRALELVRSALKWVPGTRAAVRRVRRAVFARDLRRLHDVLATTALDGRYAVCGGMLLGWARQGQLLLDDADADFVFDAVDAPAFAVAVPILARAGFAPTARFRNNNGDPAEYRFERHGA